jgi:PPOX class probable F420-dependent enzyme
MSLADEKYVATSTYRRSGEAVTTPTWIVGLEDGRFAFWTSSVTGKVKRLRATPRISLVPGDARGKVKADGEPVEGSATLVTTGPDFDEVKRRVKAKYGVQVPITKFLGKVGHLFKGGYPYADTVVLITPTPAGPAAPTTPAP